MLNILKKWRLMSCFFMIFISYLTHSYACEVPKGDPKDQTQALLALSIAELMQVGVITVSKKPENLHEAPGIVTLISREEIERFGGNSLFEVLDRVVSLHMTGSLLYPQNNAAVRGDMFNGLDRHTLLLINGRPIRASHNGGINLWFYNAFPLTAIDRIEIIRGPGSVLHGSNAYSGVINVITRSPASVDCAG